MRRGCDDGGRCRSRGGPLAKAIDAIEALDLAVVPPTSWSTLRNAAGCSSDLELDFDVSRISAGVLSRLLAALHAVRSTDGIADSFWDWLAQPADSDVCPMIGKEDSAQGMHALSRAKALVTILAQVVGCSDERLSYAGIAYFALLSVEGAPHSWGTLFQPLVFQKALSVMRALQLRVQAPADSSSCPTEIHVSGSSVNERSSAPTIAAASSLMSELALLLGALRADVAPRRHSGDPSNENVVDTSGETGPRAEVAALAFPELVALILHPKNESVATHAADGLSSLVAASGDILVDRRAAVAVLRAVLPGILMTQDRAALSHYTVPKPIHMARSVALRLARDVIRKQPTLLRVQVKTAASCASSHGKSASDAEADASPTNDSAGVDDPVLALLQHICLFAPDRADWRAAAADSVMDLLAEVVAIGCAGQASSSIGIDAHGGVVSRFFEFLDRLFGCERIPCRVMAVQVAAAAIGRQAELFAPTSPSAQQPCQRVAADGERLVLRLFALLHRRCNDAAPSVRSHALSGISSALPTLVRCDRGMHILRGGAPSNGAASKRSAGNGPCPDSVGGIIVSAAHDDKAMVRRAALGLFDATLTVLRAEPLTLGPEELITRLPFDLLSCLANDESLLVRKTAITSLGAMLQVCPAVSVYAEWANNVLPSTSDAEASVVDRALEEIEVAIVSPLTKQRTVDALPRVLHHLDSEQIAHLQRALKAFQRRGQAHVAAALVAPLVALIQRSLQKPLSEWPQVAWPMLEELVAMGVSGVRPEIVFEAWETLQQHDSTGMQQRLGAWILRVLVLVAANLPKPRAELLATSLCDRLASYTLPAEQTQAATRVVEALEKLGRVPAARIKRWRSSLIRDMEARLMAHSRGTARESGTALAGCLFTLGELAASNEAAVSDGAVAALQTLAASSTATPPEERDSSGPDAEQLEQSATRSHAIAALGKLCLRREALAKRSVELFVLNLSCSQPFMVRNSALIVLGDLCETYTSLVDRFVPALADLLRDPNELLRRQAVMILASLLGEDFVKLRGLLFYRLLYALSDTSGRIRGLVECVFRMLVRRNPTCFSQNFADAVCALNGWAGHPCYQNAVGNESFSLHTSPSRRSVVYKFMLAGMTSEQKFGICQQLVTGFLSAFADEEHRLELPTREREPAGQALSDVLALLGSKEMRICFSTNSVDEDAGEDGHGNAAAAAGVAAASAEAARTALAGVLRRVVSESIAPVLIQLKTLMEAQRSPFLGRLRHCICEVLREFQDELEDFFGGDARLVEEVSYDLKNFSVSQAPGSADGDQPSLRAGARRTRRVSLCTAMRVGGNAQDTNEVYQRSSAPDAVAAASSSTQASTSPCNEPCDDSALDGRRQVRRLKRKNSDGSGIQSVQECASAAEETGAIHGDHDVAPQRRLPPKKRRRRVVTSTEEDTESDAEQLHTSAPPCQRPVATPQSSTVGKGLLASLIDRSRQLACVS